MRLSASTSCQAARSAPRGSSSTTHWWLKIIVDRCAASYTGQVGTPSWLGSPGSAERQPGLAHGVGHELGLLVAPALVSRARLSKTRDTSTE